MALIARAARSFRLAFFQRIHRQTRFFFLFSFFFSNSNCPLKTLRFVFVTTREISATLNPCIVFPRSAALPPDKYLYARSAKKKKKKEKEARKTFPWNWSSSRSHKLLVLSERLGYYICKSGAAERSLLLTLCVVFPAFDDSVHWFHFRCMLNALADSKCTYNWWILSFRCVVWQTVTLHFSRAIASVARRILLVGIFHVFK